MCVCVNGFHWHTKQPNQQLKSASTKASHNFRNFSIWLATATENCFKFQMETCCTPLIRLRLEPLWFEPSAIVSTHFGTQCYLLSLSASVVEIWNAKILGKWGMSARGECIAYKRTHISYMYVYMYEVCFMHIHAHMYVCVGKQVKTQGFNQGTRFNTRAQTEHCKEPKFLSTAQLCENIADTWVSSAWSMEKLENKHIEWGMLLQLVFCLLYLSVCNNEVNRWPLQYQLQSISYRLFRLSKVQQKSNSWIFVVSKDTL